MIRGQTSMRLPCKLSPSEKDARADELGRALEAHEGLKLEKQDAMQRFGLKVKASERKIYDLGEVLRTGFELRSVAVESRPDFERNLIRFMRTDTWAEIGSRPMEAGERQMELLATENAVVNAETGEVTQAEPSQH